MTNAASTPSAARTRPGVGVDVVHVPRLAEALARTPGLAEVLFTAHELGDAARRREPVAVLAACFAAKEALLKALGRGLATAGPDAALQEIEVRAEPAGPRLVLAGHTARAVARRGAPVLALTRSGGHALATVLLVPGPGSVRA
jgi:holo-[acyl-carrier protein] synthase